MIFRLIRVVKRDGFLLTFIRVIAHFLRVEIGMQAAKNKAWEILLKKYNYTVAHGSFKGMKLNQKVWWSKNDYITQTLGIYEEHILKKITNFAKSGASTLIDVGAADGYFAVGMAYSNIYKNVYAFEIEKEGRDRILENANANKCNDKIKVFGEADVGSISKIIKGEDKVTVMIDIEGAEYEFFSEDMFKILSGNYVICELHPWMVDGGDSLQIKLLNKASEKFNVELIKRDTYRPNMFSEFDNLSDEERLVAVGEGREKNMQWMVLSPK